MNRTPIDIPGYYYGKYIIIYINLTKYFADKTKAKYFKVQANAAPASAAYSSTDVKRRKVQDERHEATLSAARIQRSRIKRSKILGTPISGGLLSREHGLAAAGINYPLILAHGLYKQDPIPTGMILPMFNFSPTSISEPNVIDGFTGRCHILATHVHR